MALFCLRRLRRRLFKPVEIAQRRSCLEGQVGRGIGGNAGKLIQRAARLGKRLQPEDVLPQGVRSSNWRALLDDKDSGPTDALASGGSPIALFVAEL